MNLSFSNQKTLDILRSEPSLRASVWSVWFVMVLTALGFAFKYSYNIPLAEDWVLVAPVTGHEPNLIEWFWQQNNEHRVPLPKLVLLISMKILGGDFRAGIYLNILLLALLAAGTIHTARVLRHGRTKYVDMVIPILLLNVGHWENLFWSWQLGFVLSIVISGSLLLLILGPRSSLNSLAIGGILFLLPLCGATGLIYVPLIAFWLIFFVLKIQNLERLLFARKKVRIYTSVLVFAALILTGLYFVNYERPTWYADNPGLISSFVVSLQFWALGFGPAVQKIWVPFVLEIMLLLVLSGFYLVIKLVELQRDEKRRAFGVLFFLLTSVAFGLSIGWGRSGEILITQTWPLRYALLAVPLLLVIFFSTELYAPSQHRRFIRALLFFSIVPLLPFNTLKGLEWRNYYLTGMSEVESDLRYGTTPDALAEHRGEFLVHWWEKEKLSASIQMLADADIGPFGLVNIHKPPVSELRNVKRRETSYGLTYKKFEYSIPNASAVYLVWGVDGWQTVPEDIRPPETILKEEVMYTKMIAKNDTFITSIVIPAQAEFVDYGFMVTIDQKRGPVWDGHRDYRIAAAATETILVDTKVFSSGSFTERLQKGKVRFLGGFGIFLLMWGCLYFFFESRKRTIAPVVDKVVPD